MWYWNCICNRSRYNRGGNCTAQGKCWYEEVSPTLKSAGVHAVAIGIDLYNQTLTGGVSKTLNAIKSDSDHVPCVLILNDMGGAVMHISYDVTSTLRSQTKHHEPIVLIGGGARAFPQNGSAEVRMSETAYTVSTNSNPSGRNTPLIWIYDARGNGGVLCPPQSREIIKTE